MAYEAKLKFDAQTVAIRKVGGEAERLRLIGNKSLDTVLSEIFTDLVNKVDLVSLLDAYTD